MLSYLKSEWYRLIREKGFWFLILGFSMLTVAASLILYAFGQSDLDFPYNNTRFLFANVAVMLVIPFLFVYQISQIVVGEEMKHHTLKNSISFGMSRGVIFFGKWIMTVIALIIAGVMTVGITLIAGYALLNDSGIIFLKDFLWGLVGVFPLMLAGVTTYHFLYFLLSNMNSVVAVFALIHCLPALLGAYLGGRIHVLGWIYHHLPISLLMQEDIDDASRRIIMAGNTASGMATCWIVGGVLTIVFLGIGYMKFQKMEIK